VGVTRQTDYLTFSIDDSELDKFKYALNSAQIDRARKRAADETAQWLMTRLVRQVSTNMGIKQKLLRSRIRRFSSSRDPQKKRSAAYVWFGQYNIEPKRTGRIEDFAKGAFGGEFFFDGGFVAKMPSGHVGIFKRRNQKRLKIDEQYIEINQVVDETLARLIPRAEKELIRKTDQKIRFEMEKVLGK